MGSWWWWYGVGGGGEGGGNEEGLRFDEVSAAGFGGNSYGGIPGWWWRQWRRCQFSIVNPSSLSILITTTKCELGHPVMVHSFRNYGIFPLHQMQAHSSAQWMMGLLLSITSHLPPRPLLFSFVIGLNDISHRHTSLSGVIIFGLITIFIVVLEGGRIWLISTPTHTLFTSSTLWIQFISSPVNVYFNSCRTTWMWGVMAWSAGLCSLECCEGGSREC